jgi:dolichyl-phosphate mannosyltransferase polypeptide 2 regulatory subunit
MDTTHGTLLLSLPLFSGLFLPLLLLLPKSPESSLMLIFQPFVDQGHPLHDLFPPRVWAIRIPVILILLGSAVVGSFLSVVMTRSNRKKAAKARAVEAGKKKA